MEYITCANKVLHVFNTYICIKLYKIWNLQRQTYIKTEKEIEDVYTDLNVYVFWILTGKECDIRLPVLYDSLQLHHSYFSVCYCG